MALNGIIYILLVKENKPDEVIELFSKYDIAFDKVILKRKCRNENLMVLRFHKK